MSLIENNGATAVCERLEWDSAFFGRRIAKFRKPRCLREDAAALGAECAAQGIDCAYILVDAADTESAAALQEARAYFADVRVTFGERVESTKPTRADDAAPLVVRPAIDADIPALTRIAS